jgi:DNA-binding transcriptional MocR family regulator
MTRPLAEYAREQLGELAATLRLEYAALCARSLRLDLTRGKPSAAQLDLANGLLRLPDGYLDAAGSDVRNYGGVQGLAELRDIFAELLWVRPDQLVAGGNSSLTQMHDTLSHLMRYGAMDSPGPWSRERVTFICPVPGYDRHFTLLEALGIDMVTVPMRADGPDIEAVARLAGSDPSVKGMWLVPTYSNPTGAVTSGEVAARLAGMRTAAPDFRIFWDNAYAFHHLTEDETKTADILGLAAAAGHPHRVVMFASTSKITFAGAGVAFLAASAENVTWYLEHLSASSIGPDKVNQLRHAQFFGSADGVLEHMRLHRRVLAPKFAEVERILGSRLGGRGVASWTTPKGGYFVSLDVMPGLAHRVVGLAERAGVILTPAGAAFPHGDDPDDRNLRLAPTMPVLEDVRVAIDAVATCVLLATSERLLDTFDTRV